jgi:hypothetical protein
MKKAAIEVSLGFIIAVVFAVVLLSLAIMWLRGMMSATTGLTTDLTSQARNELQRTFGGTGENFAVFPSQYELEAGNGIRLLGGIKNNAGDGRDHRFVINVLPSAASNEVCPEGDIETCSGPDGGRLSDYMKKWVTWDHSPKPIKIGSTGEMWIEVKAPSNAVKGTYMFNVYACYDFGGDLPAYTDCNAETETSKIWSTPKPLVITVK